MSKKILTLIIVCLLATLGIQNSIYAQDVSQATDETIQSNTIEDKIISPKIEKELKLSISKVYGEDKTDEIYNRIVEIAKQAKEKRPEVLKQDDLNRASDWYKDEVIYMFYVDQFGTVTPERTNQFKDTIKMLPYLKDLGVTTLYMLPFADSPMEDAGFDVKNPQNVRQDLGGKTQFEEFIKEAKAQGFNIKADLVLNHFSDQHEWFKQAMNGDVSKLDYFVTREDLPEYTKYVDSKLGTVVEYKEPNGQISKRRLIFPENTENHYRKVTINGKDYYIYHTFYPFQLDINWKNPEVLYYNLGTLNYWANLGVDIFRLDAIPYLSKDSGTNAENQPATHEIIKILSLYLQAVAPRTVLQAEACQLPKDVIPYFGTEKKSEVIVDGKTRDFKRTDEVQIAYNFPYMPALWASFITEDSNYFKEAVKQTPGIPDSASWATFLRVHDELTLEMVTPEMRQLIYNALEPKGAPFRKGFGVAGRMANFLDEDHDHIEMAFSVLLSMPGIPIIYYGDEIGAKNNFENAKKSADLRKKKQAKSKIKLLSFFDSRDINRGLLTQQAFYDAKNSTKTYSGKIYHKVQKMIALRKSTPALSRGDLTILKTNYPHVFAYIRSYKGEKYLIVNNLSDKRLTAEVDLPANMLIKAIKNNEHSVYLTNILTDEQYKLKPSIKDKKTRLLMYPYAEVWLKLP
ncbi:MAG: alpha-amylase family glycosyl hydrolase [Candidatus Gastranaerophilaceae bacterium]|mgnify:FL=1|nr:alpha-amylase family glycosyl hydrolase [Cyanobacteriota bacterium]